MRQFHQKSSKLNKNFIQSCGKLSNFGCFSSISRQKTSISTLILGIFGVFSAIFVISSTAIPTPVSAEGVSSTLSVTVTPAIAIHLLNSTKTSEISELPINITPTPDGTTASNSFIVDVATSNETGYTLYMNSDYQDNQNGKDNSESSDDNYTTSLVGDNAEIATSVTAKKNYWNYSGSWQETIKGTDQNDITFSGTMPASLIPAKDSPDTIRDDVDSPTSSSKTNITITANADTNIPAGTYRNRLTFTAVANEVPTDTFTIGNYTWTTAVQATGVNNATASSVCSELTLEDSAWQLPTKAQFDDLIGTDKGLKAAYDNWGIGRFWSSTVGYGNRYCDNGASRCFYQLSIESEESVHTKYTNYNYNPFPVVCVQKQ